MVLSITYMAFSLIAGLGAADNKLTNKTRLLFAVVCLISLSAFLFVRLNLETVVQ